MQDPQLVYEEAFHPNPYTFIEKKTRLKITCIFGLSGVNGESLAWQGKQDWFLLKMKSWTCLFLANQNLSKVKKKETERERILIFIDPRKTSSSRV